MKLFRPVNLNFLAYCENFLVERPCNIHVMNIVMLPTVTHLECKKETVHQAYIIAVES